ncbi:C40 family peptidase [Spongisporangium articulatum]|uniref:C40 family peptidase n=1 Tax=Spongisporangium articulatum TaxID=3362603 RepID=A0ABW8ARK9_9ACTN
MPVGLMTAAALVLTGASPASAQESAPESAQTTPNASGSLDEQPVDGQVAATESDTETVTASATRTDRVTVKRKLTKKVSAKATAEARATKKAKRSVTVTVTRYAPTQAEAEAEAEQVAHDAAHQRAQDRATKAAGKSAGKAAHSAARKKARTKANHKAHKEFDNLVLKRARALKGRPYRWGGNGPSSFDCSGYVRYVMKKAGVNNLPRTAAGIGHKVKHVSKKHREVGDVILFGSGRGVYHIGIYAGHGKVWHAPGSGRTVTKAKIWTSHYSVGRTV